MTKATVNYIETYFEYKELTKIHGEPTFETIKALHNQLKANASSVPSNLGGGQFGHLGLVLTPQQYALISDTAFERPNHPGQVEYTRNATGPQIAATDAQHAEEIRVFREVLGVEAALRQQLVGAIEDKYLMAIRNRNTNAIVMPVHDIIMTHLYPNYGDIDPHRLQEEEEKVKNTVYDVTFPPDTIYMIIEDLMDLAEAAEAPFSQRQAVMIGYNIMNRTGRFKDSLREWIRKPTIQQTWIAFKTHFSQAHKELKKLGALTLEDTIPYQQANVIQQIVYTAVEEAVREHTAAIKAPETPPAETPPDIQHHQANAASQQQDTIIPLMMQQMKQMQEMMQAMQTSMLTQNQGNNGSNYKQPANGQFKKAENQNMKYCWTHGHCFHDGATCTRKAQGHKDAATHENRMNGSTKGYKRYLKQKTQA